jgi:uncharacterized protein YjbI with pentapeptide repeats
MANQEHLDILKQGVYEWNQWRADHPTIILPILFGEDLHKMELCEANLRGALLRDAILSDANLSGAILREANLREAILINADLSKADLREAKFFAADLSDANLCGADLNRANLSYSYLERAHLNAAYLSDADLTNAHLQRAILTGADLTHTVLTYANFRETNLKGANLSRAHLKGTDLSGANLKGANFEGAVIDRTNFANIDLSTVKGLNTVRHNGPSTIGIDTIYLSKGNIPEDFLKGTGVDDTFITYISSWVGKAIEYYSCFISYSSKDEAFAERLHADLQSKGVRCWFAPEDLKVGDKIRLRIDESIRLHDKLLLVLSKHSTSSQWVEQEVATALAKEREEQRTVLFPIRLDKTIMEIEADWPFLIRNTRNIGDFTRWKNHDEYEKAFNRLLRDLKAGE